MLLFFAGLLILIVLVPVVILGAMGFVPGLSSILGTDKPRDLGVKYTAENLKSVRSKSQIQYEVLPDSNIPSQTRQFSGERKVTAEFTSSEITASLNNRPWKLWPYKNMQIKFNSDGSAEISGQLLKNKVSGYAAAIGVPAEAVNFAMKYLPADPVFYVKAKAALTDNKVSVLEPQTFEIGRIPIPLNVLLSFSGFDLIPETYAIDISGMSDELNKVDNKKELIIGYINSRLSGAFGSFYAKKAYFGDDKLFFDGTLTEKISYSP